MLGDKLGEFTCLANGGHNTIGSLAIWQATTHFEVIIDDTCYSAEGRDFDHKPLCLQLSINCSFVEPQRTIEANFFCLGSNMINQKLKSMNLP